MFCRHCGKERIEAAAFCRNCGQKFLVDIDGNPIVGSFAGKKRKWVRGLAILVVIGAVAAAFFFFSNSSNAPEDGYEEESSILTEMSAYLEPLGRFDEPSLFDAEISDEEWFSHLQYFEGKDFASAQQREQEYATERQKMFSSVVKIICEDEDAYHFGSGTNFDRVGYVITNLHVVEDSIGGSCVVGFADPRSGLIQEVYWATPIVDDDGANPHDLALLSIEEPVFDEENNIYGYYERLSQGLFPDYDTPDGCDETEVQLGEDLFVVGYPPLSGGSLTVTNGVVSSLYSQDNYIITSAKIVSGNSGGLAVDERGCFIGVPTAVYFEEGDEYLGEIIDNFYVIEFMEAVEDEIDEYVASY